jgi:hypothetical protein
METLRVAVDQGFRTGLSRGVPVGPFPARRGLEADFSEAGDLQRRYESTVGARS